MSGGTAQLNAVNEALRGQATSPAAEIQQAVDSQYEQCMADRGEIAPSGSIRMTAADMVVTADAPTAADVDGAAASPPPISSQDMAAAYGASDLKRDGGHWVDECGTAVEPKVTTLHLGGAVGEATMVAAEDGLCFGNAGDEITLFRSVAGKLVCIEQDQTNDLIPLPTSHLGVADIQLSLPGFAQPVLRWDGNKYVAWHTVKVPPQ